MLPLVSARVAGVFSIIFVFLVSLSLFRALPAADCNTNGTDDTADIASGTSADCNANSIPDECEGIPLTFVVESTPYPVPPRPRLIRSAPIDADEELDLIVTSRTGGASSVSILYGRGDGSFGAAEIHPAPRNIYDLLSVDLDGDSHREIVTASADSVLVFPNRDGSTLGEPALIELAGDVRALAAGDLNQDGAPDLVAADRDGDRVLVMLGRGDGSFDAAATFPAGNFPTDVIVEELNGDGVPDVAALNRSSRDLSILLGAGGGRLLAAVSRPIIQGAPVALAAADFNGDGRVDLAVLTSSRLVVLLNAGDGSFPEESDHPATGSTVLVADFDRDGDLDLVTAQRPSDVAVRVNDGRGGFGVVYSSMLDRLPTDFTVGNFNDDGAPEIVTVHSTTSAASLLTPGENAGEEILRTTVPLSGCGDTRGCRPHSGAAADFNGDGRIDVFAANTHPGSFAVLLNDGAGQLDFRGIRAFGGEHPQSTAAGDVDGDGDIDAVTCDNLDHHLYVHLNRGDGSLAPPRRFRVGSAPINVQLGDLDGDGHLDAVTANEGANSLSVLFGNGDAVFAPRGPRDHRVLASPKSVALGDLDADGALDLVAGNAASPNISVFKNNGDGTFGTRADYRIRAPSHHVAIGDFDDDGRPDLTAAMIGQRACAVLLQTSEGSFDSAPDVPIQAPPYSVVAVDFNSDGAQDLVTGSESASVGIALGNGDGTFQPVRSEPGGTGLRSVLPADLDADGDVDLVTIDREGRSVTVLHQRSQLEAPDFLRLMCTPRDFHSISAESQGTGSSERFVKYILPAENDPALLPLTFQNTERYRLHEDFLVEVFPKRFPALTAEEYSRLVGRRVTRQYFVGALSRLERREGDVIRGEPAGGVGQLVYGFSVFADFADPAEALSEDEVKAIYLSLRESFSIETLAYAPRLGAALEAARQWEAPDFPVLLRGVRPASAFEAYTQGIGYGRVMLLDADEFEEVNANGRFSFQDVLVLASPPRDIEGVAGGVVTALPQGELSHVAVRTARRGTPNAYVLDAMEKFAPFEGRLVRLEVNPTEYRVREATLEEAREWWTASRPTLSVPPTLDSEFTEFSTFAEILAQERAGVNIVARFGGKASNLARLQGILDAPFDRYRADGFAIPMYYYLDFLRTNHRTSAFNRGVLVSYETYLEELFASEEFASDSAFRFAALADLREHAEDHGIVPGNLVTSLAIHIVDTFDSSTDRVRFRSSSNVEDSLEFNGAGLYDSTSACAADDLDLDGNGPSRCDATRDAERGVARALKRVWASLWNFRAYEERAFYGVDPDSVGMGILVTRAFVDERAGGVAFTGNPSNPRDRRFVVIAQAGEASVVTPEPGVVAEKNLLEIEGGAVARVIRAQRSSLVPEGRFVLSDEHLRELGALMAHLAMAFPVDPGPHSVDDILLDIEFKVDADGLLAIKQVRPFLRATPVQETPTFELLIPEGVTACGVFRPGRGPRLEYELKSELRLAAGNVFLPSHTDLFAANIVEELRIGPERELATPAADGLFRVNSFGRGNGRVTWAFEYEQDYTLADGREFQLQLTGFDFEVVDGQPVQRSQTLDEGFIATTTLWNGTFVGGDSLNNIAYASCSHDELPLWDVRLELFDGSRIELEERFLEEPRDTGPASLRWARVELQGAVQEIADYWRLVYSASRHNEHVRYWVVLDPPLTVRGLPGAVQALGIVAPEPREGVAPFVEYLGEDLQSMAQMAVTQFVRERRTQTTTAFRRGDFQGDGEVEMADALNLLAYLFQRGPAPGCRKSADATDDGRVNVTDAIYILLHLFHDQRPLPAPVAECAVDPTPDELDCLAFPACE